MNPGGLGCGGERSMYSLVAQLVEHLKLNQEVPGSFPGWGIMIFSLHRHQTVRAIYCPSDNLSYM